MSKVITRALIAGLAIVAFAATAQAGDEGQDTAVSQERQEKLMERFGDQGIDANEDGVLTRDEIHAFLGEKHGAGKMRGKHAHGYGGKGQEAMLHHMGMALTYLEIVNQDTPPDGFNATTHPKLDTNGDGELSVDEWQAYAEKKRNGIIDMILSQHSDLDKDGDKTLNDEELEAVNAMFRSKLVALHPEADADKDGSLTVEEFVAFRDAHMEEMRTETLKSHPGADLDGDGKLSDGEMHAFMGKAHDTDGFGCHGKGKEGCQGKGCKGKCDGKAMGGCKEKCGSKAKGGCRHGKAAPPDA